jgi:hypothetical protein
MDAKSLAALVALNVALLAALVVTLATPQPAEAQFAAGGQYLMIAGAAPQRSSQSLVYIVDARTGRMITVMFNSANNNLEFVAGADIGRDTREAPTAGRGR